MDAGTYLTQELQQLAEADMHDLEQRMIEAEATIRDLKNQISLNSQTIRELAAYRVHLEPKDEPM